MSEHDPAVYIEQIIIAARKAVAFLAGMSEPEFLSDDRTQQAVAMSLIIIGENGKRLMRKTPAFTLQHADVPWHDMAFMRKRIAHGYETLQFPIIYSTVRDDLPALLRLLEPLLAKLDVASPPDRPMADGDH